MNKEKMYEANLRDLQEERKIHTTENEIIIRYEHQPNSVGPRSEYTGLPVWVGRTLAEAFVNGKSVARVEAKCWMYEPFNYSQARIVSTGRILKKLKLPTDLALLPHIKE